MKIELSIPKTEELSETDRQEYCASISAIFPRIEKDIKRLMYEHLVETYTDANDFNKVLRGQGIMEGMAILLENWGLAHMEHLDKKVDE